MYLWYKIMNMGVKNDIFEVKNHEFEVTNRVFQVTNHLFEVKNYVFEVKISMDDAEILESSSGIRGDGWTYIQVEERNIWNT